MYFYVLSQISVVMRDSRSKMLPHLNGPQFLCVYSRGFVTFPGFDFIPVNVIFRVSLLNLL